MRRLRAARAGGGDAPHERAQRGDERGGRLRVTSSPLRRVRLEATLLQAFRGRHARGDGGDNAVRARLRSGGHHHASRLLREGLVHPGLRREGPLGLGDRLERVGHGRADAAGEDAGGRHQARLRRRRVRAAQRAARRREQPRGEPPAPGVRPGHPERLGGGHGGRRRGGDYAAFRRALVSALAPVCEPVRVQPAQGQAARQRRARVGDEPPRRQRRDGFLAPPWLEPAVGRGERDARDSALAARARARRRRGHEEPPERGRHLPGLLRGERRRAGRSGGGAERGERLRCVALVRAQRHQRRVPRAVLRGGALVEARGVRDAPLGVRGVRLGEERGGGGGLRRRRVRVPGPRRRLRVVSRHSFLVGRRRRLSRRRRSRRLLVERAPGTVSFGNRVSLGNRLRRGLWFGLRRCGIALARSLTLLLLRHALLHVADESLHAPQRRFRLSFALALFRRLGHLGLGRLDRRARRRRAALRRGNRIP